MSRWTNWLGPLDCTDNLKALWAAYEIGVAEMPGEVYKETGYQVAAFLHGLIPMLMQVLIALAATTALGGAVGALVGAFFGGAGAIPGGAIGAQAGFDLGVLILTWMGLAFLIEAIGHGLVELTSLLTQAVRRAWAAPKNRAVPTQGPPGGRGRALRDGADDGRRDVDRTRRRNEPEHDDDGEESRRQGAAAARHVAVGLPGQEERAVMGDHGERRDARKERVPVENPQRAARRERVEERQRKPAVRGERHAAHDVA